MAFRSRWWPPWWWRKELCSSSGEFSFDGGMEVELKGISRPHRVFAVDWQADS